MSTESGRKSGVERMIQPAASIGAAIEWLRRAASAYAHHAVASHSAIQAAAIEQAHRRHGRVGEGAVDEVSHSWRQSAGARSPRLQPGSRRPLQIRDAPSAADRIPQ